MKKSSLLLLCFALMACTPRQHAIEDAVVRLTEAYPQATAQDIYKSFYQDCFGPEHFISDTASVRAYLHREIVESADDTVPSAAFEPTGAEGRFVRVYLRCVYDGRLSEDELFDAFIHSPLVHSSTRPLASRHSPFASQWQSVLRAIDRLQLDLPHYAEDTAVLNDYSRREVAVHHSEAYRNAYHPHYRIVRREVLDSILALRNGCSYLGEQMLRALNEERVSLLVYNPQKLKQEGSALLTANGQQPTANATRYTQHGVRDLLYLCLNEPERLNGAIVADKKIGTAAATLMALGKVKEAHTNYITDMGKQILDEAGIRYHALAEGPMIYQRDGVSRCPVDKGTSELSTPEERLQFIIDFYNK